MEEKFILSQEKKTDFLEDIFMEYDYKEQQTHRGASEVEDMNTNCMCNSGRKEQFCIFCNSPEQAVLIVC